MRCLAALAIALVAGCSSAPRVATLPTIVPARAAGEAADRGYLLDSAAADFRTHGPVPAGLRNVRFGYVESAGGGAMAIVGGEWIAFTTLQTSKYEQYIGGQGDGFCKRPAFGWDKYDLSAELQKRLDALE
jgi:hypothetical protein